jgi:putative transposase
LIDSAHPQISLVRQCELLGLSRSSYYYQPLEESKENLQLMRLIDEQYLHTPFYGVRKMWAYLQEKGYKVNVKKVRRLMRLMGLEAIYPKKFLSQPAPGHVIYPYLLKGMNINRVNQVWSTDITYIPMAKGFMYLAAIIDWYSRYVLSWQVSNSLEGSFCLEILEEALQINKPSIFNTDQGTQFTSLAFTNRLKASCIQISMDGRGRALDNIFIERLWRSVKYEYLYLHTPKDGKELQEGLKQYFIFYNTQRPHQSLNYQKPAFVYAGK